MKVLLCENAAKGMRNKLESLIQQQLPNIQIETVNSIMCLSEKLCRPLNKISVIVIFVICEKDINRLLTFRPLFDNIRLILILPNGITGITALWPQLNPCFISDSDSEFFDIISVLNKIYQRAKKAYEWQAGMQAYIDNTENLKEFKSK